MPKAQTFNLLIDIQACMANKRSPAYRRWATIYNLKQMSGTRMFLRENHIESFEDLDKWTEEAAQKPNDTNAGEAVDSIEIKYDRELRESIELLLIAHPIVNRLLEGLFKINCTLIWRAVEERNHVASLCGSTTVITS